MFKKIILFLLLNFGALAIGSYLQIVVLHLIGKNLKHHGLCRLGFGNDFIDATQYIWLISSKQIIKKLLLYRFNDT